MGIRTTVYQPTSPRNSVVTTLHICPTLVCTDAMDHGDNSPWGFSLSSYSCIPLGLRVLLGGEGSQASPVPRIYFKRIKMGGGGGTTKIKVMFQYRDPQLWADQ
jgi:hypothetical protein